MAEIIIPLSAHNTMRCTTTKTEKHEPCTFIVSVPTQLDREMLAGRLYELGIIPTSTSTVRATIVNELFEILDEEAADEGANHLDEYWRLEQEEDEARRRWELREAERVIDEAGGAAKREPEPQPDRLLTARQRYRAQGLLDLVNEKSLRYRQMMSRRADWDRRNAWMTVRIQVIGCEDPDVALEQTGDRILTEDSMEAISKRVGVEGLRELIAFVQRLYGIIDKDEQSLNSPVESDSGRTGSTGESDGSASTNGGSTSTTPTTSPIEPAPEAASETITERS